MAEAKPTKNQHFVPQMLLRRFAVPNTRQRAVATLDLEANKTIPIVSIAGQCARPFFYGEDGIVERSLGHLEGAAGLIIESILRSESMPAVGTREWSDLITFVVVQHGRTPSAVNVSNQRLFAMIEEARKFARNAGDSDTISEIARSVARSHPPAAHLRMTAALAPVLWDLDDLLLINETRFGFATSDLGVFTHNQWAAGVTGMGTDGLACSGQILLLPLSPRHLLMKFDPDVYHVSGSSNGTIRIRDEAQIKALNFIQLVLAERNLYFDGDPRTREGLEKLSQNSKRFPLSSMVRAERLIDQSGTREFVRTWSERPKMLLALDWLRVKPRFAKVPLPARASKFRPEAMAAYRAIRGESAPPDSSLHGSVLRRVRKR
ncbi:DUF4238 domain-containing protein [Sorangium sp. So ce1153]|uniref:DUF4238 domain-containing protein n=1 Tax=Sorangium sp. So ce1153 TaxID=3133333 RepID=UPI003F5E5C64